MALQLRLVTSGVVAPEADPPLVPLDEPPTFSIVIPVYQGAHLVGEATESLLAQTVSPHEIIVCDDGSTDDLAGALAPYGERITVLRQEHKGVAAALNLGLFHATGEFVAACGADDTSMPRMIEALGELAKARPDLDILARVSVFERDGKPIGLSRTPEDPRFPVDDQRMGILQHNFVGARSAVRRQRLLDIGGYDETLKCAEDYDSWVRLIFAGCRAGLLLEPLGVHRYHKGSLSTNDVWCLQGRISTFAKLLEHDDLSEAERAVATERIAVHRRDLERAEAREEARSALLERRHGARRLCLRVVLDEGQALRTRLKAGVAALAPRLARGKL
jgi:glycosyltransferase involved in cell wall biosynthesis